MRLKLRDIAEITGVTPGTVHDMEMRGICTSRAAKKYAAAFPGKTWLDLLDDPLALGETVKQRAISQENDV